MQITITAESGPVLEALGRLGSEAPRALTRALNRTLDTTKTAAVRALSTDIGLTQTTIRENVRTVPATFDNQVATLIVSGRRIPLLDFGARQTASGVSYRLRGGQGTVPHAFIATMRSGHRGVFARRLPSTRRSRGAWGPNLPIVELYGPSLPHVFEQASVLEDVVGRATEVMGPNLQHEIGFLARQLGLKTDIAA